MPYTGYDPFGPAPDPSGGGLDPSFYYAASPGGRFPGDIANWLEYQAGQSRGTAGGNPDYDVPDWAEKYGRLGKILGWHERNVRQGGEGQSPDLPGGYPYHFFSGPAAQFGPPGGPLHGLVDQGRPGGGTWDQDRPGSGGGGPEKPGKKKGGGGGGGHKFSFTPYAGISHQPSFVDWQPTQPFQGAAGETRFVPGAGYGRSGAPPPSAPPAAAGAPGPGGRGGGGKGRGGTGAAAGTKGGKGGKGGKNRPAGGPGPGPGPGASPQDILDWIIAGPGKRREGPAPGPGMRDSIFGGVDPSNLDMGTPGWLRDRTSGIGNTNGFPGPTPSAPMPGESWDQFANWLHDSGMRQEDIGAMLGPYGYRQNEDGGWEWGWGTGPVVRGEGGYQFANQGPAGGNAQVPWFDAGSQGAPRPGGGFGGGGAGLGGGAAGTGGGFGGGKPDTSDYLTGGVFSLPAI